MLVVCNDIEQEQLLREGVQLHSGDTPHWVRVAEHINAHLRDEQVTNDQCRQRWKYYADPKLDVFKDKQEPWTEQDVRQHL